MSLLSFVVRGVDSSAVGTLVMDALLYRRYRGGGGRTAFVSWETSDGRRLGRRTGPGPRRQADAGERDARRVPPRYARTLNDLTHWGFGLATGAAYGLLAESRKPSVWYGLPFGAAVWAAGYVVLPLLGVYQPIWKYDLKTLEKDLSAHLVFGAATAATFRLQATSQVDR